MKRWLAAAAFWGIFGTVLPTAAADPVRVVTSGSYVVVWGEESNLRLLGAGFEIGSSAFTRDMPLFRCHPCSPGSTLDLSATLTGALGGDDAGSATVDGTSYSPAYYLGEIRFASGSVVVPDLPPIIGADEADASLPFVFTAQLSVFPTAARTGPASFTGSFTGSGIATVTFINNPNFVGLYADRISYTFDAADPVPEPASLLLVGGGLAVAIRRRHHRRARA